MREVCKYQTTKSVMGLALWGVLCLLSISCGKDEEEVVGTGIVSGIVSDYSQANSPIAGATVVISPKGLTMTTGSDGRFEFTELEPGTYTISASADNFQSDAKRVEIYAGQASICDFQLDKASVDIDISPLNLVFGRNMEQASFTITNNTNGALNYSISNYPEYIQVSPVSATVVAKGKQAVGLTLINRSSITSVRNGQLTVNVGSDSYVVNITIDPYRDVEPEGDDNPDENPDDGDDTQDGEDVTFGLSAYYIFDNGTANDEKGAYDAFLSGGSFITNTANGKGKALQLKQGEYMTIGENPLGGKKSFTVSMWVKDFGTGVFLRATSGNYYDLSPTWNIDGNGKITYNTYDRRYGTFGVSLSGYSNKWTMLTIVSDGSSDKHILYVNGSTALSITSDGTMASTGCSLQIGGQTWYSNGTYLGYENAVWTSPMKIDNIRLYTKALTASEVRAIYNVEK